MQQFQQFLQRAIQEGAITADIVGESTPTITTAQGESPLVDLGNFEAGYIKTLFNTLFPSGVAEQPVKGQIDIPNFGKLLSIAVPKPIPTLKLFFPNGHHHFDPVWEEMQQVNVEPMTIPGAIPDNPFENGVAPPPPPGNSGQSPNLNIDSPGAPAPAAPDLSAPSPEDMFGAPAPAQPADVPAATVAPNPAPSPDPEAPVDMFAAPPIEATAPPPGPAPDAELAPPAISDAPVNQADSVPIGIDVSSAPDVTAVPDPEIDLTAPTESSADSQAVALESVSVDQSQPPQTEPPAVDLAIANPIVPEAPIDASTSAAPIAPVSPAAELAPPAQVAPVTSTTDKKKLGTTIPPGPKKVDDLLRVMLDKGASDLHVTSDEAVAFRIDGDIVRMPEQVYTEDQIKTLFFEIAAEVNQVEFEDDNDTDFAYEIPEVARFRVNLFRDRNGMGAVLRHIPSQILTFDQLGLPDVIRNFCYLNKGLVVVTGPTGSGKSTTLAAIIDHINDIRKDHILTLEDPIEFVHPQKGCLIRQREIHKHTNSFSRALKAALREDPDIILVGELRDLETTAMAIEIAETGHLVFGTLHTTTAISTIDRIIDQFSADQQEQIRTMLSESLKGVVAQTLLKKIGGGRCAAQEILVVNSAVSALVREAKTHMLANHMQSQKKEGNVLLNDALLNLVVEGKVDPKEAWSKAIDKKGLIERYRMKQVDLTWYEKMQLDSEPKAS